MSGHPRILFFCAFGDDFAPVGGWVAEAAGLGTVALAHYGRAPVPETIRSEAARFLERPGFKIDLFRALFEEPGGFSYADFDAFVLIDDDLLMASGTLKRFVDGCIEEGLDLAQPALEKGSVGYWHHTHHKPGKGLVPTDFVEAQFFFVSARAMEALRPTLLVSSTGFGLDFALMIEVARRGFKAAVDHRVSVLHPRRKDPGATVKKAYGDYARQEKRVLEYLRDRYGYEIDYELMSWVSRYFGTIRFRTLRRVGFMRGWFRLKRMLRKGRA